MTIDVKQYAGRLNIVKVYEPGNPSGVVTDRRLYNPRIAGSFAPGWPADGKGRGGVKHATVGSNSLAYLAGGSINDQRYVCAQYHFPKDDYTLNKLVPNGFGCNHAYPASWRGYNNNLNANFYGFEVENLQNGKDPFTFGQYMKFALCWAYLSALDTIPDLMLVDHGICAPPGHRSDPYAGGMWNDALFYGLLWEIRKPEQWPGDLWQMPLYDGGK